MLLLIWKAVKKTQRNYGATIARDKLAEMYCLCDKLEQYTTLLRNTANHLNMKPLPCEWFQNAVIDQSLSDIRNHIKIINTRQKQVLLYILNNGFNSIAASSVPL